MQDVRSLAQRIMANVERVIIGKPDAVRLAMVALEKGQIPPITVNFAGDDPVSIEDYCRFAGRLLGVEPTFRYTDETYPANQMDTTLMHEVLGRCEIGWQEGFRRLLAACFPDGRPDRV